MGFNVGFNCNEAVNFAVSRWFGYALQANICDCNPEMAVRMNLREILSKYVENDNYKECFIREPAKKDERTKPALGISSQAREALPVLKRLLLFDSSFEEEIEYNQEQADISPFCCVCQYFTPRTNCQLKGPIRSSSKWVFKPTKQQLSRLDLRVTSPSKCCPKNNTLLLVLIVQTNAVPFVCPSRRVRYDNVVMRMILQYSKRLNSRFSQL